MWHWQVKKLKKLIYSHRLLLTGLACASAGHMILLLFFIVGYQTGKELRITINPNQSPASVVLMPLVKKTNNIRKASAKSGTTQVKDSKPKVEPITSLKKDNDKPKQLLLKTTLNTPKTLPKKEQPKKKVVQKKSIPSAVKKNEPPKTEPKSAEQVKHIVKNETPPIVKKEERIMPIHAITEQPTLEPVAVGYEELQELQMHDYFRQEIVRNWSPPPGFGNNVECEIQLQVSRAGLIEKIEIKKSSGSLAYDTSVKRAIKAITIPKWAYDKSVYLQFKQT